MRREFSVGRSFSFLGFLFLSAFVLGLFSFPASISAGRTAREVISDRFAEGFKVGGELWQRWGSQFAQQYDLKLEKISITVDVLQEIELRSDESMSGVGCTGVVTSVTITCFCTGVGGGKKRFVSERTIAYEVSGEEVLWYMILDIEGSIKDGWSKEKKVGQEV